MFLTFKLFSVNMVGWTSLMWKHETKPVLVFSVELGRRQDESSLQLLGVTKQQQPIRQTPEAVYTSASQAVLGEARRGGRSGRVVKSELVISPSCWALRGPGDTPRGPRGCAGSYWRSCRGFHTASYSHPLSQLDASDSSSGLCCWPGLPHCNPGDHNTQVREYLFYGLSFIYRRKHFKQFALDLFHNLAFMSMFNIIVVKPKWPTSLPFRMLGGILWEPEEKWSKTKQLFQYKNETSHQQLFDLCLSVNKNFLSIVF